MLQHPCLVATLVPVMDRPGFVETLLDAGVDIVRINFSDTTVNQQRLRIRQVRQAAQKCARPVTVLAELPGPKVRVVPAAPPQFSVGKEVQVGDYADASAAIRLSKPSVARHVRLLDRRGL